MCRDLPRGRTAGKPGGPSGRLPGRVLALWGMHDGLPGVSHSAQPTIMDEAGHQTSQITHFLEYQNQAHSDGKGAAIKPLKINLLYKRFGDTQWTATRVKRGSLLSKTDYIDTISCVMRRSNAARLYFHVFRIGTSSVDVTWSTLRTSMMASLISSRLWAAIMVMRSFEPWVS
jgi:hypothetical protein